MQAGGTRPPGAFRYVTTGMAASPEACPEVTLHHAWVASTGGMGGISFQHGRHSCSDMGATWRNEEGHVKVPRGPLCDGMWSVCHWHMGHMEVGHGPYGISMGAIWNMDIGHVPLPCGPYAISTWPVCRCEVGHMELPYGPLASWIWPLCRSDVAYVPSGCGPLAAGIWAGGGVERALRARWAGKRARRSRSTREEHTSQWLRV